MRIEVKVKPNARESLLSLQPDETWIARLKSPPVDGKANKELIALVAKQFGVARSRVTIKIGASSRIKIVEVEDRA